MTVNYTWKIEQLDAASPEEGFSNTVCRIHWRLYANDGRNDVDIYGDTLLGPPGSDGFIDYSALTEANVIQWLEAAIDASAGDDNGGGPTVEAMRGGLAARLTAKAAPGPRPLPWT